MIRRVLTVAVGLLAALCCGCVQTPVAGGPQPSTCPAVANVMMLPASFEDPQDPNIIPSGLSPAPANMVNDVQQAYALAPAFFQTQLCALDGIFIVPHRNSWGVRNPNPAGDGKFKKYIALSGDLWPAGGSPKRLPEHETEVVDQLLSWNGPGGPSHTPMPGNSSYDPAVTILAVMAHEYGHVLFYDTFVDPPGTTPNYTAFCGGNFYKDSWASLPQTRIPWRGFSDIDGLHKTDDVSISDILGDPSAHRPSLPQLSQFYRNGGTANNGHGRWASLWAGFSPDHDFVETFKLFVLINSAAKLKSLQIDIPGQPSHDILATCNSRAVLNGKLGCFQQPFCPACSACPAP